MKKCPKCKTGVNLYQYMLAEQNINMRRNRDAFKTTVVARLDDCYCKKCGWKGKIDDLIDTESELEKEEE